MTHLLELMYYLYILTKQAIFMIVIGDITYIFHVLYIH
ncbi:hypothetical protein CHCC20335_1125 [Bacillus paralicheniformis]|nr:hypothetical protein CHCC20335_1125 [Bacillus paralicheniformis]